MQMVYLGGDSEKRGMGNRKDETGKRDSQHRGASLPVVLSDGGLRPKGPSRSEGRDAPTTVWLKVGGLEPIPPDF